MKNKLTHMAVAALLSTTALSQFTPAFAQEASETASTKEYFSEDGLDVLVFSNWYDSLFSDAKISGVELIQHDNRVATNGDIRLSATPGQWEPIGTFKTRRVDVANGVIEADLEYADYDFQYTIRVEKDDDNYLISVHSETPVPNGLAGKAGFNLEFIPSVFGGKSLLVDGHPGILPTYAQGDMELRADGERTDGALAEPLPIASGKSIILAPADEQHRVSLKSMDATDISLYDGRNQAQNGWFVVRSVLPEGKTGKLMEWRLDAAAQENWERPPVISYNQLGYHPARNKTAIIEMDAKAVADKEMHLLRFDETGKAVRVKSMTPKPWGNYLRYKYASFDFSDITETGVYALEFDGNREASFSISDTVYDHAWHPTSDVFFPVQMDHMYVNEAYRAWHGKAHMDDALQAPVDHEHHDLYRQGPTTDTDFEPLQHIPGLNVGGWFDAGDFDIRTQSQYSTIRMMARAWDNFSIPRDQTSINWDTNYTDMHVPDGAADIQQQVKHGTLQLLAQYDAVGHAIHGIVAPDLDQYTFLGDAGSKTDNRIYDANMSADEETPTHSGKLDDRWAFTSRSSALEYGSAAGMAAAARTLKGYDDALAEKALQQAITVFAHEESNEPTLYQHGNTTGGPFALERIRAAGELLLTTKDPKYAKSVEKAWDDALPFFAGFADLAVEIKDLMPKNYDKKLRKAAKDFIAKETQNRSDNPFGVQITRGGWAGSGTVANNAIVYYFLHKAYPDLVSKDRVYAGFDFLLGQHPGHNLSLVSAVGAKSKKVAYGNNRADFSYIAGGVVPGVLVLKPDYPENREDWPFFWGQNEYVIPNGAQFIFLANAVAELEN
ncbi:glycoside hydrolase family 9 protein [Hirschia baltica]|uniref:Glycoside hydrolase family 9 n=1 Tax=Hirschia baltica (strain ATCC 49814 / DSM 5838 / IFAM 1418) TaxID=582402 RepID=C6XPM6_HIRBI|nr:glycoside hydrolase family 9 protein [Hirschia baltica]ACT60291.1 glycoside hydrolase family 9 [Hirschia baltica ATCC 49814]